MSSTTITVTLDDRTYGKILQHSYKHNLHLSVAIEDALLKGLFIAKRLEAGATILTSQEGIIKEVVF